MTPRGLRLRDVALLTAVLAFGVALPLRRPLVLHGEAREGLVIQDIVAHGSWLLPHRNGALPSKPPFYHWVAAGLAHVTGLSDVTVRLPSVLGAWVMSIAVLLFGTACGGRRVGWLAVGALWGTSTFWVSAVEARVDMLFSACITTAVIAFFLWYRDGGAGARALCYLAVAAAVLTKGPAGAVLTGAIVVTFALVQRDLARLRAFWSWSLGAATLLVTGGWYAVAAYLGGRELIAVQILHENIDRLVGQGTFSPHRHRTPFRMEGTLVTHLLPWNLVLVDGVRRRFAGEREDAAGRFLHVWWMVVLGVFSLAAGKRGVYLLPLYPAIALLAARALDGLFEKYVATADNRRQIVAFATIALVAFDATIVFATHVAKRLREERASLVEFARQVEGTVPATVRLRAADLPPTDVWVLAYRLGRPIERSHGIACDPGTAYLLPANKTHGYVPLVASRDRHGGDVALVRCDAPEAAVARSHERREELP